MSTLWGKGKTPKRMLGSGRIAVRLFPNFPKLTECAFIKWGMRDFSCAHEPRLVGAFYIE